MVKDIDVLWDVVFVICMIYGSMRDMEVKDSKKYEIITAGEVVKIAFQEERFCKRRVWRCVQVFGDKSSKIGVFSEYGE